ncbi:MAG: hypothetical protein GYB64_16700, partial [Chloroflexi bacterium]|nr:hypothetical protein [Chloroflexota bacterium]
VDLTGLAFSEEPPAGGSPTTEVEVFLEENLGGIFRFAYEEGEWLFFHTDRKMVEPQEMPEIDRLTGEQLAFANVVILYVEHSYTGWIEDQASSSSALTTELTGEGSGYLVRDGQVYDIVWRNDPAEEGHLVELLDGEGDLIPLRPGQTMFFAVQSPEQLGFRFYAPTITFR